MGFLKQSLVTTHSVIGFFYTNLLAISLAENPHNTLLLLTEQETTDNMPLYLRPLLETTIYNIKLIVLTL